VITKDSHHPRNLSIRGYLILLVLAILVPGGIFAGVLSAQYYNSEVRRIEDEFKRLMFDVEDA